MSDIPPLTHLEARVLAAIERHVRAEGVAPTIAELAGDLRLKSRGTVHRYVQSLIAKGRLERQGNGWRGLRIVGLAMPERRSNVHHLQFGRDGGRDGGRGRARDDGRDGARDGARDGGNAASGPGRRADEPPAGAPRGVVPISRRMPEPRAGKGGSTGSGASARSSIPLLGRIAAGLPIEAIEEQSHLDLAGLFAGPERFALRVSGDSMIDAGILDGDTVIVRKQDVANVGDIVVALIDGQEATLKRLGRVADGFVELVPANASMETMRFAAARVRFQGVLVGQLRQY